MKGIEKQIADTIEELIEVEISLHDDGQGGDEIRIYAEHSISGAGDAASDIMGMLQDAWDGGYEKGFSEGYEECQKDIAGGKIET